MRLNNLFLTKVFKQNKILFTVFCTFIFLSLFFNYKGVETTPFFIWAMFSGRMAPKTQYKITTVTYNDGKQFNLPHTFQEPQSMMVYFTINHYRKIEANNMMDPMSNVLATVLPHYPFLRPVADRILSKPAQNATYRDWLKRYLQSIVGEPVDNATIFERTVHFDSDARVIEDSSKILFSIQ